MKMNHNSRGRGQSHGYLNSGPLMTDHLRVRNLDRELQMLRRKRQVVEREQQMLTMESQMDRKGQYEQPNRNVSNMYGNAWQPPPPKRANVPRPISPWINAPLDSLKQSSSQHMPSNYIPSLLGKQVNPPRAPAPMKQMERPIFDHPPTQRPHRPINIRNDSRFNQVTKRKTPVPPNKLSSYSIKERKNLVSLATDSLVAKNFATKFPVEQYVDLVLRDGEMPSRQVVGRLELALGSIVKEIRCSDTSNTLSNQRALKQAIRERLRTVMLNKHVGSVVDIVNNYRKKFPKQSDKDIIDLVIKSEQLKFAKDTATESPEEFFKRNINSILEKKIQEMFTNLRKMYGCFNHNVNEAYYKKGVNVENKDRNESGGKQAALNEQAMKILRGITGKYCTSEEKDVLTKYYTQLIEEILEEKIPEYLPKCKDELLKILDLDKQIRTLKYIATKQLKNEAVVKTADGNEKLNNETNGETDENLNNESNSETDENEAVEGEILDIYKTTDEVVTKCNEIKDKVSDKNNEIDDQVPDNEVEEKAKYKNNEIEEDTGTENNGLQEEMATENVPGKEISSETNETPNPVVEESSSIQQSETQTLIETQQTCEDNKPATPMVKQIETSPMASKTPTTLSTPTGKELPYYVKLIGRPKLPNRAVICEFLNSFRPNSIKKHKSINNLLVVGFNNQEDYHKIIAANETVLDDVTIIIKASEKVNPGKENEPIKEANDEKIINKETKEDKAEQSVKEDGEGVYNDTKNNSDDLIGKELDDQITDLLSTINEVDEATNKGNTTPSSHTEDGLSQDMPEKQCLEPIKEDADEVKNKKAPGPEVADKNTKNVKESGRATPVRSSSRLANVTPSTIRTRRASRLMQE